MHSLPKQATGTWNVTFLVEKDPKLVCELEKYQLTIVGLTSIHGLGSITNLLKRGWTLFHSPVAHGERYLAGVGLFIAPQIGACVM